MGPMGTEKTRTPYPVELRERAVRMVREHEGEHASRSAAVRSVAGKVGCHRETLRLWLRQAERDQGIRPGPTSEERERIQALEREVRELAPGQRDPQEGQRVFCPGGARPPVEAMIAFVDDHRAAHGVRADLPSAADRPVDLSRPQGRAARPGQALDPPQPRRCAAVRDRTRACGELRALTACARSGGSCAARGSRRPGAPWKG